MLNKNTCIIGNIYGLFVCLLLCHDVEIDNTLFIIDTVINKNTVKKEPKNTVWIDYTLRLQEGRMTARDEWRFFLQSKLRFWSIGLSKIYAQDNIPSVSPIVGFHKYSEIEDAPYLFSLYKDNFRLNSFELPHSWSGIKQRIRKGNIYGRHLGRTRQCINRYVSLLSPDDAQSELLKGKNYTVMNLQKMWNEASEYKKEFILQTFGINIKDLSILQSVSTIILTQPFIADAKLTIEEQMDLYRPYIEKYAKEGVVIKPHPREKIDYNEFFPDVTILPGGVPIQVFNVMGCHFERAVTVCSTAISSMVSNETEIVWIGTRVHPNIFKVYGEVPSPKE